MYINAAEKRLKKSKDIEKRIIGTSTRKNGFQYYLVKDGKRTYVRAKDLDMVRKTIQKNYDEAVHQKLLTMRYRTERFLKLYDPDSIKRVYSDLTDARKLLVTPLIMTDEQYIKEWYLKHPDCQNTFPMQNSYMTSRNEKVRSKSEKIIADLFDKYSIPYKYEPQLVLAGGRTVIPDFVVLNVRQRKTIYWEHFGLISDGEYAKRTCEKIYLYEDNGFIVGDNILFSMESEDRPLNVKQLEAKIKIYLI